MSFLLPPLYEEDDDNEVLRPDDVVYWNTDELTRELENRFYRDLSEELAKLIWGEIYEQRSAQPPQVGTEHDTD